MNINRISGLLAAAYTPLTDDYQLNLDEIENYYKYLKNIGIIGVFLNGSTSDFNSLNVNERNAIVRRWTEVVDKDFIVFVHVAHNNLEKVKVLTEYASRCQVNGISTLGPYYYKINAIDELVSYCRTVASYNPEMPFYYYHIPKMTGIHIKMNELLDQAKDSIPNLAGCKFTHDDLVDFKLSLALENEKYNILFGNDEIILASLAMGARGCIGSTYNHAAVIYYYMIESFKKGNMETAQALQLLMIRTINTIYKYGWVSASKRLMKRFGVNLGPARQPHKNITDREYAQLETELDELGLFGILNNPQSIKNAIQS